VGWFVFKHHWILKNDQSVNAGMAKSTNELLC